MRARMRALLLVVLVIATREAEARLDPDAVLAERVQLRPKQVQGKDLPGRGLAVERARNMNFITYHVLSSSGASEAGPMQYLVKTDKAGRQDILKELEDMLGWRAIRYVPFDSFVVSMTAAQRSAVAGLRGCLAVYHLPWVRIVWFL